MLLPDLLVLKLEAWQELLQAGFEARGPLQVGQVLLAALASAALAFSGASLAEPRVGSGTRELSNIWRLSFDHLRPGVPGWLGSWLGFGNWTLWLRLSTLIRIIMMLWMKIHLLLNCG